MKITIPEGTQIVTFSIKPSDTEGKELVARIKYRSTQSTISFSHHVLAALKEYEQKNWPDVH